MNPFERFFELSEDWRWLAKRDGLRFASPYIVRDLIGLPYRRLQFYLFRRSLSVPIPPIAPRLELEIRPFQMVDIAEASRINLPSEACLCARRLKAGHWGLAAIYQGCLAGYAWASSANDPELDRVQLALVPGQALCTDAYTDPTLRGRGVQLALTLSRLRLLEALGFKEALSYIVIHNKPSIHVWQKKLGSELIGEYTFIRFGPWRKFKKVTGDISKSGCIRFDGVSERPG